MEVMKAVSESVLHLCDIMGAKLESGKNNVSIKMLFKISRALGVKLFDIFYFDK